MSKAASGRPLGPSFIRGKARVRIVFEAGWHTVTIGDSSNTPLDCEVASYRDRNRARTHALQRRTTAMPGACPGLALKRNGQDQNSANRRHP